MSQGETNELPLKVATLTATVLHIQDDIKEVKTDQRRLEDKIEKRFDQVDKRFDQVNERFERINEGDRRIDALSERLDDLRDEQHQRVQNLYDRIWAILLRVSIFLTLGVWGLIIYSSVHSVNRP